MDRATWLASRAPNHILCNSSLIASPLRRASISRHRPTILPSTTHNDHHRVCPSADKPETSALVTCPPLESYRLFGPPALIVMLWCTTPEPLCSPWFSYHNFSRFGRQACSHYLSTKQPPGWLPSGHCGSSSLNQCALDFAYDSKKRGLSNGERTSSHLLS